MTWGNTTAKCLNKIQTQQNYLIKIISNAPYDTEAGREVQVSWGCIYE